VLKFVAELTDIC